MGYFAGQSLLVIIGAFLLGLLVGWLFWGRRYEKMSVSESEVIRRIRAEHGEELAQERRRHEAELADTREELDRCRKQVHTLHAAPARAAAGAAVAGAAGSTRPAVSLPEPTRVEAATSAAAAPPATPSVEPAPSARPVVDLRETPTVSAPTVSAPTVSAPTVSAPTVSAPTVSAPVVSAPTVSAPTVSAPVVSAPTVSAPTVSTPVAMPAADADGDADSDALFAPEAAETTTRVRPAGSVSASGTAAPPAQDALTLGALDLDVPAVPAETDTPPPVAQAFATTPSGTSAPGVTAARGADDDLERIEGIGPKMAAALRAGGITTFATLALTEAEQLRRVVAAAGLRFAPSLSTWAAQAKLLAEGDEEGFAALTARLVGGRDTDQQA